MYDLERERGEGRGGGGVGREKKGGKESGRIKSN